MNTATEEGKLLPCPFCGNKVDDFMFYAGTPEQPTGCSWLTIYCGPCGFQFQLTNTDKEIAIEKWNRRNESNRTT